MDYQRHHDKLIARAKIRLLEGYSERHHIVPRCMGGDNSANNLVYLTAEEHYVVHQLLVKIYPEHHGLAKAAGMMTFDKYGHRTNNKEYGWVRRRVAKANSEMKKGQVSPMKGRKHLAETKAKLSALRMGKPTNTCWIHNNIDNKKIKISEAETYLDNGWIKGRLVSAKTRKRLSEAGKGQKRPPSAEHRRKNSEGQKGKKLSEEHKKKIRQSMLDKNKGPLSKEHKEKISRTKRGIR